MSTRDTILSAFAVTLTAAMAWSCSSPGEPPPATQVQAPAASSPAPPPQSAPTTRAASDLPPLPQGIMWAVRSPEIMRATYEFAARQPDVMRYVPCFCGCERGGHKDNSDCFVAGRDGEGHVTAWETHALGCEICVDVAYQAMQMYHSGASPTAIRSAIEKKYASYGGGHTPTPMPPKSKGS